jgi:hypothetical protein
MLTFGFFPKIKYTQNSELVSNENVKWNDNILYTNTHFKGF